MKIRKELLSKVLQSPEYLYGVHLMTLVLGDGQKITKVEVSWEGEILRIQGKNPSLENVRSEHIIDVQSEL